MKTQSLSGPRANNYPRIVPYLTVIFNDRFLAHLKGEHKGPNTKSTSYNTSTNARLKLENALESQVRLLLRRTTHPSQKQSDGALYYLDPGHAVHVISVNLDNDSTPALFPYFGRGEDYFTNSFLLETEVKSDKQIRKANDGVEAFRQWLQAKSNPEAG